MAYHKKARLVRTNDEIEKRAQELKDRFPQDYNSISQVYRAAIMNLYNSRFGRH